MPALDFVASILLFAWASLMAGGFLLRKAPTFERPVPAWIYTASWATLLLLAWYGFLLTRAGADSARYALGIAAGLTFSLLGGLRVGARRRRLFAVSTSALCHLLYIGAIAQFGATLGSLNWLVPGLWLLSGALAAGALLLRARRRHPLRAAATVAYTLLLFATAGLAIGLALTEPRFVVLAAGAFFLLISDITLVLEPAAFPSPAADSPAAGHSPKSSLPPSIGAALRLLLAPGQALIILSIWSALQNLA